MCHKGPPEWRFSTRCSRWAGSFRSHASTWSGGGGDEHALLTLDDGGRTTSAARHVRRAAGRRRTGRRTPLWWRQDRRCGADHEESGSTPSPLSPISFQSLSPPILPTLRPPPPPLASLSASGHARQQGAAVDGESRARSRARSRERYAHFAPDLAAAPNAQCQQITATVAVAPSPFSPVSPLLRRPSFIPFLIVTRSVTSTRIPRLHATSRAHYL